MRLPRGAATGHDAGHELEADTAPDGRLAGRGEDDPGSRAGAGQRCSPADAGRVDGAAVRLRYGWWETRHPGRPADLGGSPGTAGGRVRDPRLRLLVRGRAAGPPRDRRPLRRRLRAALPDPPRGRTKEAG